MRPQVQTYKSPEATSIRIIINKKSPEATSNGIIINKDKSRLGQQVTLETRFAKLWIGASSDHEKP